MVSKLNTTLDEIEKENPTDYSEYIRKILEFIRENEENYRLAINASDMTIFASKLKSIFSKRIAVTTATLGFSPECEKRSVQVYFLISACVDTVIQYLKGDLTSSIDIVGEVISEAVEKLKRND